MKEFERFERIGTAPHRSYYVPFAEGDVPKKIHGIIDRASSSRFISLDGEWLIKEHASRFARIFENGGKSISRSE